MGVFFVFFGVFVLLGGIFFFRALARFFYYFYFFGVARFFFRAKPSKAGNLRSGLTCLGACLSSSSIAQ